MAEPAHIDTPVPQSGPDTLEHHHHHLPDRRILTYIGVLCTMFLAALDQTVVGTALPHIVGELRGFDRYSWVATSYLLCSTAIIPVIGKISEQLGRKRRCVLRDDGGSDCNNTCNCGCSDPYRMRYASGDWSDRGRDRDAHVYRTSHHCVRSRPDGDDLRSHRPGRHNVPLGPIRPRTSPKLDARAPGAAGGCRPSDASSRRTRR